MSRAAPSCLTWDWLGIVCGVRRQPQPDDGMEMGILDPAAFEPEHEGEDVPLLAPESDLSFDDLTLERVADLDERGLHAFRLGSRTVRAGQAVIGDDGAGAIDVLVEKSGAEDEDGRHFFPLLQDLVGLDERAELRMIAPGLFKAAAAARRDEWLSDPSSYVPRTNNLPLDGFEQFGCERVEIGRRTFLRGWMWDARNASGRGQRILVERSVPERVDGTAGPAMLRIVRADLSPGREVRPLAADEADGRFIPADTEEDGTPAAASGKAHVFLNGELIEVDRLPARTAGGRRAFRRQVPLEEIPEEHRRQVREGRVQAPTDLLFAKAPDGRDVRRIEVDRGEIRLEPDDRPMGLTPDEVVNKAALAAGFEASGLSVIEDHGTSFDLQKRKYYVPIDHDGKKFFAEFKPANLRDLQVGRIIVAPMGVGLFAKDGPEVAYDALRDAWIAAETRQRSLDFWIEKTNDVLTAIADMRQFGSARRPIGRFQIADNMSVLNELSRSAAEYAELIRQFMDGRIYRKDFLSARAQIETKVLGAIENERSRVINLDRSLVFVANSLWSMFGIGPATWINVGVNLARIVRNPGGIV